MNPTTATTTSKGGRRQGSVKVVQMAALGGAGPPGCGSFSAGILPASEVHRMERGDLLTGSINSFTYRVRFPAKRRTDDYTPRMVPFL